jgi:hypothetical protein
METVEYLTGFNYRLGEREWEAITRFAGMVRELEQPEGQVPERNDLPGSRM